MTTATTEPRARDNPAPELDEITTPQAASLVPVGRDEESLTLRAERSLLDQLQRLEEASVIFKRRAELLEQCHLAAIKRTRPEDWVLSRDRDGNEIAMLAASGSDLAAEVYGIVVENVRPRDQQGIFRPERVPIGSAGAYLYRAWCDAYSRVNGRSIEGLEFSRHSTEDFTGRRMEADGKVGVVGEQLDSDLRLAVMTGLRTKAVRVLAGLTRVPRSELDKAWQGTGKDAANCRRGHGYGTTTERTATGVAEEGVEAGRAQLRDEILRRVGGKKSDARDLLVDCTKGEKPGKDGKLFPGFESIERLTQGWQIENAWRRLREHPNFGDHAQQREREPGEEG